MNDAYVRNVIEAALLAAGGPLPVAELLRLFDDSVRPSAQAVRAALMELAAHYQGRGIELLETASGFRIQVRRELAAEISRLWPERTARYSRALLETLALIAYRQPITRAEIEAVRGVAVNPNIIRTLLERNWVRVVGHRAVPGHPELLGTTREFLDYFGLKSLDELPPLAELAAMSDVSLELALAGEIGTTDERAAVGGDAAQSTAAVAGEAGDAEESSDDEELSAEGDSSAELVAGPHELDG
jgi:segregation and condensation protein B